MKNARVAAHLNPNTRKRERGEGERSQPPGSEAFFGNTFRHATGDGQLGPFHAGSPLFMPSLLFSSCHET